MTKRRIYLISFLILFFFIAYSKGNFIPNNQILNKNTVVSKVYFDHYSITCYDHDSLLSEDIDEINDDENDFIVLNKIDEFIITRYVGSFKGYNSFSQCAITSIFLKNRILRL